MSSFSGNPGGLRYSNVLSKANEEINYNSNYLNNDNFKLLYGKQLSVASFSIKLEKHKSKNG